MTEMTIKILKNFLDNIPDDYTLKILMNGTECSVDKLEIDVKNEVIILK